MPDAVDRVAHLAMIQGVISRMASNSFQLKTLSVTFAAALIAYLGAVPSASAIVVSGAIAALVVFWLLDARYVRLERQYRTLYESVAGPDYSMSLDAHDNVVPSVLRVGVTWSVVWVYAVLVLLLAILGAAHLASAPAAEPATAAAKAQ